MRKLIHLLITALVLNACTIEKRTHLSGYHIDFKKPKKNTSIVSNESKIELKSEIEKVSPGVYEKPGQLNHEIYQNVVLKDEELGNEILKSEKLPDIKFPIESPTSQASNVVVNAADSKSSKVSKRLNEAIRVFQNEPAEGDDDAAMLFGAIGLALSILGLLLCWIPLLGWFFGGLGMIFGYAGLKKNPSSKGLVYAALAIGGLAFALSTGLFFLFLLLLL